MNLSFQKIEMLNTIAFLQPNESCLRCGMVMCI